MAKFGLGKIKEGIVDFFSSLRELKEVRRIKKESRVKCLYVDKNNVIQEFTGFLDKTGSELRVKLYNKMFGVDKLYYDRRLKPLAILSWGYPRTIDLTDLNSKLGEDFSIDAFRIMSTKVLEFLEEPTRKTIIYVFLFGILLGIIFCQAWIIMIR